MLYLKKSNTLLRYLLRYFIVMPIISTVIIPLVVLDIWVEIYHRTCFPVYGFPYIKRSTYIKIDRHKLKYLDFFQKIYCAYCGYGNGVINYWVKIASQTEYYWCGIQHNSNDADFKAPPHHKVFAKYNDEEDFMDKYLK